MNNWLSPQIVEQARERHALLLQEATQYRLLQQGMQPTWLWLVGDRLEGFFRVMSGDALICKGLI